jgi:hypothetical protein
MVESIPADKGCVEKVEIFNIVKHCTGGTVCAAYCIKIVEEYLKFR